MPTETQAREAERLLLQTTGKHETIVFLRVTEYEASILEGALASFDPPGYPNDGAMARNDLRERVTDQLPAEWREQ